MIEPILPCEIICADCVGSAVTVIASPITVDATTGVTGGVMVKLEVDDGRIP